MNKKVLLLEITFNHFLLVMSTLQKLWFDSCIVHNEKRESRYKSTFLSKT